MAISYAHFDILRTLHSRGVLPQGGRILEVGEANYYGDFPPQEVFREAGEECDPCQAFDVAKLIYKAFFDPEEVQSIDMGGPTAAKLDLNYPVEGYSGFDVTINHGTAEHIFNIAQVFQTMHHATAAGGLMFHEGPFTGWVDHGFYCLQPTLFWDVADVNDYEVVFSALVDIATRTWSEVTDREDILEAKRRGDLEDNLELFVVFAKRYDATFVVPTQGVYRGSLSESAKRGWRELR